MKLLVNASKSGVRCNLHGACGGKANGTEPEKSGSIVAICTGRVEAKADASADLLANRVAICTGRVEAKVPRHTRPVAVSSCNLHGACGGKESYPSHHSAMRQLQSARGVWRQSLSDIDFDLYQNVAICTGRVEAKVRFSFLFTII